MYTHLLYSYILNFLALADIKDFGRMQLFTMLPRTFIYTQGVFV